MPPRLRSPIAPLRLVAGIALAVILSVAVLAPTVLGGARFGRLVESRLPPTCGQIHIGGGRWTWAAALAFLRGRPAALELTDVAIRDPEGAEVLRIRRLSGRVEVSHDRLHVKVHDVRVDGAAWRFAMGPENGRREVGGVGFLRAFMPAGGGAEPGRCAPRPPRTPTPVRASVPRGSFEIDGATIDGLDVTFDLPGWGLVLKNVRTTARLAIPNPGAAGGDVAFEVMDADARGGGELRVLAGPGALRLPFSRAALQRVATTAARPDAIELAASVTTGRSRLVLSGAFTGVFAAAGPRRSPGIELEAQSADAADTVQAVVTRRFPGAVGMITLRAHGPAARLALGFHGRFDRLAIDVRAGGFDVRHGNLALRDVGFHLSARPLAGRFHLADFTATSPEGGRLGADVDLERRVVAGRAIFEHFATTSLLPGLLVPLLGGTLDGAVRGRVDLATASAFADELALTLQRPPGLAGPSVVHIAAGHPDELASGRGWHGGEFRPRLAGARMVDGTFHVPEIASSLWGGRLLASGKVTVWDKDRATWLSAPVLDLAVRGERISLEKLLGVGYVHGTLSFRATARGRPDALALRASLAPSDDVSVLGQRFRLPAELAVRLDHDELLFPELRLVGAAGGALSARGKVGLSGRVDVGVTVDAFPLARLPGLADTALPLGGRLDGKLRLVGAPGEPPKLSGELSVNEVSLGGRPLGAGALTITPVSAAISTRTSTPSLGGAIAVRGHLGTAVTAKGMLAADARGLRAEATIELDGLQLEPFFSTLPGLSSLPGGLTLQGVASGAATARVRPGHRPSIAGSLTELQLSLTGPSSRAAGAVAFPTSAPAAPGRVTLRAVGQAPVSAEAAGGHIHLGPAAFTGELGDLEISAEADGKKKTGALRGRVNLAPLAPLLVSWLDGLSGAMDIALVASDAGGGAAENPRAPRPRRPRVTGTVTIAAPVVVRPARVPFAVEFPAGRIDLSPARVATDNLLARLAGGTLRVGGVLTLPPSGAARVDARVRGDLDARLLEELAPTLVQDAAGMARLDATVTGTLAEPRATARVALPRPIELSAAMLGPERLRLAGGSLELDGDVMTIRALDVALGARLHLEVGADGIPGTVRFTKARLFDEIAELSLPLRGSVTGLAFAAARLEHATFALRLTGDPRRRLRLGGEVWLDAARVSSRALAGGGTPGPGGSSMRRARALAEHTDLDVRLRARDGGLIIDLPYVPDPHLNIDLRVGGTLGHPTTSGQIQATGVYSFLILALHRLFD